MLRYSKKTTLPMHRVQGSAGQREAFMGRFEHRYGRALDTLAVLEARNREEQMPDRALQPYFCIGCDVGDGALRAEVLSLAACPLYQVAVQGLLGKRLALQCYFSQTYEPRAGVGPGGVIGVLPETAVEELDTRASRAFKYWRWVDADQPAYLPEEQAEAELWKLSYIGFCRGKAWLASLPAELPPEGVEVPAGLGHDTCALLGVPAMQRLVATHLGKDLVMFSPMKVGRREDLHWSAGL
ncbi:MAG: hypothetical protein GC129_05585 [Proteobacteria bacterium]|nr:hypothetical protein [Pseudomonadota bacterium]